MYKTYLLKLKPLSSYMTLWQSDTIYGHLLWAIFFIYGEEELKKVIDEFKNSNPPFIVSDGFIGDKLPLIEKEIISNDLVEYLVKKYKKSYHEVAIELKKIKNIKKVSLKEFNQLRKEDYSNIEWLEEKLFSKKEDRQEKNNIVSIENIHNRINRITNTTKENGLFSTIEYFTNENIYIYIKLKDCYDEKKFFSLIKYMEETGFGKKKSIGKGSFKIESFEKFDGFEDIKGNGFITLSNYIPKEFDYDTTIKSLPLVKNGKVGIGSNPFKKTFSCFKAGSLFKGGENRTKGKILTEIHENKDIIQIGIPFILEVEI